MGERLRYKLRRCFGRNLDWKLSRLNVHIVQKEKKIITVATQVTVFANYKITEEKKLLLRNRKKLKGSKIFINEDFYFQSMLLRKQLWEDVNGLFKVTYS